MDVVIIQIAGEPFSLPPRLWVERRIGGLITNRRADQVEAVGPLTLKTGEC